MNNAGFYMCLQPAALAAAHAHPDKEGLGCLTYIPIPCGQEARVTPYILGGGGSLPRVGHRYYYCIIPFCSGAVPLPRPHSAGGRAAHRPSTEPASP